MARVDFYILSNTAPQARILFACRVLEKAFKSGQPCYVHCTSSQEAIALDDLLWTYRDDSFLPHQLVGEPSSVPPPIHIGFEPPPADHAHLLINLTSSLPTFYTQFQRVIEIVPPSPEWKERARTAYKLYRDQGCELQSHNL